MFCQGFINVLLSQLSKPLEDTPLTIIDDIEQLQELLDKLKKEKEIAIDLEVSMLYMSLSENC